MRRELEARIAAQNERRDSLLRGGAIESDAIDSATMHQLRMLGYTAESEPER
jgi:hypothetical protein